MAIRKFAGALASEPVAPIARSTQFVKMPVTLITHPTVSNGAFHLFAALATFVRGAGTCRVARKTLAQMIGVRVQDLRRWTQELVEAEVLTVMRVYDPATRRHKMNGYHLRVATTAFVGMPASVIGPFSHGAFRCYAAFLKYRDADGECFPTQRQLAADLHCDVRTVRTYLRRLTSAGLVMVEPRGTTRDRYEVPSLVTNRIIQHLPTGSFGTYQPDHSAPLYRSTEVDPLKQIHTGADAPACVVDHHEDAVQEDVGLVAAMPEAPAPSQPSSSSMTREIAPAVDRGADSLQTPPPTPAPPRKSVQGRSPMKRRTTTPRPSRAGAAILATLTSLWPDWSIGAKDRRDAAWFAAEYGVEPTETLLHWLHRYEDRLTGRLTWDRRYSPLEAIKDERRQETLARIDAAERRAVRELARTRAYSVLMHSRYSLADFDVYNEAARRHGFAPETPPDWVVAAANGQAPVNLLRRPGAPPSGIGPVSNPEPARGSTDRPAAPAGIVGLTPEEAA